MERAPNDPRPPAFSKQDLDLVGEEMATPLEGLADLLEDHEWVYEVKDASASELVDYIASVVPELGQYVASLKRCIESEDYNFAAVGDEKHNALARKVNIFNGNRLHKNRPLLSHVLYGLSGLMQYFIDKRHSELIATRGDRRTPMGREKKFYHAYLNIVDRGFRGLSSQVWSGIYFIASIRDAYGIVETPKPFGREKSLGAKKAQPSPALVDEQAFSELLTLDFERPDQPVPISKTGLSPRLAKVIVKMEIVPKEPKTALRGQGLVITNHRPLTGVCFINIYFPNISGDGRQTQFIPLTVERNMGGELIFSDQFFTPLGEYFKHEGIPLSEYQNLKQVVQKGILDAYRRGDFKTVEQVEKENAMREKVATQTTMAPENTTEAEDLKKVKADDEECIEDIQDAHAQLSLGTLEDVPTDVLHPQLDVKKRAKAALATEVTQKRQISVEEACRAFGRIAGVSVISGGKHQKIVREGKPSIPFFNPHANYNEALVWRVAKKAARLLGIYQAFIKEVL